MKTKLLLTILALSVLIVAPLTSAEVIPVWMKYWNPENPQKVHDFEFLRGEDEFIMLAGIQENGAIQIRNTLTGELVTHFPLPTANYLNQLEITPDSNRIVITTGGDRVNDPAIELRNIEDFSLINRLPILMDADSIDIHNQPYYYTFRDIVIDPVRPYIYAFLCKNNYYTDDVPDRVWLKVYNYETMEEVKDLTPDEFKDGWPDTDLYPGRDVRCLDVSDDGKYLAVLNEGKAYLRIWDLGTMKLIINKQLYDGSLHNPNYYRCEAGDIEFSHIDGDLIYISGGFPNKEKSENPGFNRFGLYKYRISTDNFYKDYIGYSSYKKFVLFDNEERVLMGEDFFVLNQIANELEIDLVGDIQYPTSGGNLYSKKNDFFLGKTSEVIAGFRYDSQTRIESNYDNEVSISPNPTTGKIIVSFHNQKASFFKYSVISDSGQIILINELGFINSQNNQVDIDITSIPQGHYILKIFSEQEKFTFNIIKEG